MPLYLIIYVPPSATAPPLRARRARQPSDACGEGMRNGDKSRVSAASALRIFTFLSLFSSNRLHILKKPLPLQRRSPRKGIQEDNDMTNLFIDTNLAVLHIIRVVVLPTEA